MKSVCRKAARSVLAAAVGVFAFATAAHADFTSAQVPADGVYKFTFGVDSVEDGFAVPADAVYDVQGTDYYTGEMPTFSYGFLGTTDTSYQTDIPASPSCSEPSAIDGFQVVQGQKIVLHDAADSNNVTCVKGPAASEYLPVGASPYEGRYPIRFSMRGEERAYYAVTCTVANASSTESADVTVFSERQHIIAHHLALAPGETKTFAWSVELAPNVYKTQGTYYDNAVNICVVGENAALASVTIVKQPQRSGTVRGEAVDNMNVGKTIWLCTDSTGTDQRNATPYFSLQNYSGVGSGLSRWAPANISIRNQGEGGLATNANTHRKSCLLKPGDYLYVEYGHNESGAESYTNNLETYLQDVNDAGAYLLIVSPVERRSKWDSETSTWGRSLDSYATAGEAWVEDKIAQGARNVAFIDLNKRYNDWMNEELRRINAINPDVSLNAAISFYYKSSKGANVDNTHINNAGTDQAAYWVWYDALQRVADGENAEEGSAAKVQADVLKGITEGYQGVVGIGGTAENLPWLVTDEIINAGVAPNSFWDTPVSTGYDYVNDAVVASVAAVTNSDRSVTISGVTMRILNPDNYYKAVIDIFDAEGNSTRYWSYYNYDIGGAGKVSGDLVDPNQPGFLNADKDKADVTEADLATLTIPAGGKALVWIAKADAGTWQTGDNGPCSPKYPVEWWSEVLIDNDCSSLDGWGVNTGAINTKEIKDGALYFTTAGADSNNTKKNYGLYHKFDDGMAMTSGRYRITFRAMIDSGTLTFCLADSVYKTTTVAFNNSDTLFKAEGTKVTGYKSLAPLVTQDEAENKMNVVNKLRWLDVDIILDRDNDRALFSVGGSDYVEYINASRLPTDAFSGLTWNYFGITCPGQQSSYGYVDDVKVVKLASVTYPSVTAHAAASDADMGYVTINGSVRDELTIYSGRDFVIRAESADDDQYAFVCWRDAGGSDVSSNATLFVQGAMENLNYTAIFREYGENEDRVTKWDFSGYQGDFAVIPSAAQVVTDNGMAFYLQGGDSLTGNGLYWENSALGHSTKTENLSGSGDHYIVYTPSKSGTLTLKFSVDAIASKRNPTVIIKAADSAAECQNNIGLVSVSASKANTEYTLSANLTAGTTYYIWTYSYNWGGGGFNHNYTIPSIVFTYNPVYYTVAAAVAESSVGLGFAQVDGGSESVTFAGKTVDFVATPVSAAYKFTAWTNSDNETISTDAEYSLPAASDMTLFANFALREAGESYEAKYDFAPFAGSAAADYTSAAVVSNGWFELHMVSGDSIGSTGAKWYRVAVDSVAKGYGSTLSADGDHYIKFIAPYSGTVKIAASVDSAPSKSGYVATMQIKNAASADECINNNGDANKSLSNANTEYELSHEVEVGKTYFIWTYGYNNKAGGYNPIITISSITYTYTLGISTLTLADSPSEGGTVSLNGMEGAGEYKVQAGEYVYLSAQPIDGNSFLKWTNEAGDTVSEDAAFWYFATSDETLTANWQTSYVWNRNVAAGNWEDRKNWLYGGAVPESAPTFGTDPVVFNSDSKVTLPDGTAYNDAKLTLDGNVTFVLPSATALPATINQDVTLSGTLNVTAAVGGEGTLTLADATLVHNSSAGYSISCPLAFEKSTTSTIQVKGSGRLTLAGGVSGEGDVVVEIPGKTSLVSSCDFSEFGGSFTVSSSRSDKTSASIYCDTNKKAVDFSKSSWSIYETGSVPEYTSATTGYGNLWLWRYSGEVIKYGQLNVVIPQVGISAGEYKGNTLEVGALDKDSSIRGTFYAGSEYPIRWVARTATLQLTAANTYSLEVTGGGTVDFGGVVTGIPSDGIKFTDDGGYVKYDSTTFVSVLAAIKNSDAMIGIDIGSDNVELDLSSLDASNSSYIGKKGTGTLTLTGTLPASLYIASGAVVLPADAEGTIEVELGETAAVFYGSIPAAHTYDVAADTKVVVTGALNTAAWGLEKSGEGALVLAGINSFVGPVNVNAGTLKLGGVGDFDGVLHDFDASRTDLCSFNDDMAVTVLADAAGKMADAKTKGTLPTATALNGRNAITSSNVALQPQAALSAGSTFMAVKWNTTANYQVFMQRSGKPKERSIATRNDSAHTIQYRTGASAYAANENLYKNGNPSLQTLDANPMLLTANFTWQDDSSKLVDYACGNSVFGEAVAFDHALEGETLALVENMLMAKWGVSGEPYTVLPTSADVSVKSGATLDLGSEAPTVNSLTLESGATLKVGNVPADGIVVHTTGGAAADLTGVTVLFGDDEATETYNVSQTAEGIVFVEKEPPVYEFDGAENVTQTGAFESYKGKASIVKNGSGTLTVLGNNTFTGDIAINAGTIRMGGSLDIPGLLYDFDVSAVDAVVTNEVGEFSALKDAKGTGVTLTLSDGATAPEVVTDAFGGRKSLYSTKLRLQLSQLFKTRANQNTAFLVWRTATAAYTQPMGDINDSDIRWAVGRHNTSSSIYEVIDYKSYYSGYTWGDGVLNAPVKSQTDQLLTIDGSSHRWLRADGSYNSRPFFGSNADCHIGEAIMSTAVLTEVERQGCEAMLMYKWGIKNSYSPISPNASVVIAGEATLDLGGFTQTVAALSVAADGIVTNGTLVVTSEPDIADGAFAEATDNGDGTWTVVYKAPVIGPTTDDENATVTENPDGSYTVAVEAESVEITIPDGVTVSEVVVSTNTTQVTGVPSTAAVKVAVSWMDSNAGLQTASYAIVKIVNNAVVLDENAVVAIGEENIPLKPTLAATGEATAPLVVEDDNVALGVKSIPGLVYRLSRATALTALDPSAPESVVASAVATGARTTLADSTPPAGSAFYVITVDTH